LKNKDSKRSPSIISGAIWSVLDNAASQVITFVIFIILARVVTPSIYGMLSISLLVTQFFRIFIFDSIATSIIRKKDPSVVDYNCSFLLCFLLSLPAFLIVFVAAPFVESYMNVPQLSNVIRATGIIILVSGLTRTHEAWLMHHLMFRSLAIRSIISISIGGIVGVYLAYHGHAVASLVVQQVVASFISLVVLWIATPWKPRLSFSRTSIKESLGYSKHVALSNITFFVNQSSDVFFVTYFLGSTAAGAYSAGKRIVNTLSLVLTSALTRVSLPAFARYKNDINEFGKKYLQATYFTALITAPAFIGLATLSHDVTYLLLGDKWMSSVPVMQIVSAVGFITAIGNYNQSVIFARDKPQWQARLALFTAMSNVIAFYFFVRFGVIATALIFSVRTVLLYPVSVWCALTLLNLKFKNYFVELIAPVFCSLLMCLLIVIIQKYLILSSTWLGMMSKIFIGAMFYTLLIIVLSSSKRRVMILSLVRKIVNSN